MSVDSALAGVFHRSRSIFPSSCSLVLILWHRIHNVCIFDKSELPPSATGTMWSASHSRFPEALYAGIPYFVASMSMASFPCVRAIFRKLSLRDAVSRLHSLQTALSRFFTWRQTYVQSCAILYWCTHSSEHQFLRRGGTSASHQQHKDLPFGPNSPATRALSSSKDGQSDPLTNYFSCCLTQSRFCRSRPF